MQQEKEKINYKEVINKIRPELDKAISYLETELSKIRTSRANPSLVEDIVCDCFGQKFPLKQLAAISIPESRQILIHPWDKSYFEGIVAALEKTGIGANPIVDKDVIRINLPPLNEEYRNLLNRQISEKRERIRQTVRHWRDKIWDEIQDKTRNGLIREDDKFKGKNELQKIVDEYNEKIDKIVNKKKEEIKD